MTAIGPAMVELPAAASAAIAQVEIHWSCSARACAPSLERDPALISQHDRALVSIEVDVTSFSAAMIVARVAFAGDAAVLFRGPACCIVTAADELVHVDAWQGNRQLISLTLDSAGRLLYARSNILSECGVTAGRSESPRIAHSSP